MKFILTTTDGKPVTHGQKKLTWGQARADAETRTLKALRMGLAARYGFRSA